MGPGYVIEGDYLTQVIIINGKEQPILRKEPLQLELMHFLGNLYTEQELIDAIDNVYVVSN